MPDMRETLKYTFTVEGETEQWYLLWLRDQINPELFMSIHQRTKRCLNC